MPSVPWSQTSARTLPGINGLQSHKYATNKAELHPIDGQKLHSLASQRIDPLYFSVCRIPVCRVHGSVFIRRHINHMPKSALVKAKPPTSSMPTVLSERFCKIHAKP